MVGKLATTLIVIVFGLLQTTMAAKGKITVNGREYIDPFGCIRIEQPDALAPGRQVEISIHNQSDKLIKTHSAEHCQGEAKTIHAGIAFHGPSIKAISID